MKNDEMLQEELKSFKGLWTGGFYQGHRRSAFNDLDKIEKICIRPYVNGNTSVLEIGPGGGFWTRKMLMAKSVVCMDALSAEHNKFWERIGKRENVRYFCINDFRCKDLQDDSIDYVFSYDVFCHISYSGSREYIKNLYPKMKNNSMAFIMIADANKYIDECGRIKLARCAGFENFSDFAKDYDGAPIKGRWYFYGTKMFCDSLGEFGYTVVNEDVALDADRRSPIVCFRKQK